MKYIRSTILQNRANPKEPAAPARGDSTVGLLYAGTHHKLVKVIADFARRMIVPTIAHLGLHLELGSVSFASVQYTW